MARPRGLAIGKSANSGYRPSVSGYDHKHLTIVQTLIPGLFRSSGAYCILAHIQAQQLNNVWALSKLWS
ncbi:hypothetical protein CANTEDRAFT_115144 [Yamadazyma tenuis ATCC 10573]|uniref:Uncharacterized protein n=1 Tax=Candida tenuis (strain ATCC 10573 / BCRC 21748 / CBS 615 / JCM 9827 / NBRC 10315 / NRRL Y-1498 / VKM Y-70) TaxID=590646 RepID=G3B7Y1_CANTC|nr:uncharacterized protein CANTEDRAFT_115144 [Yamadazyma tenuis ATCC 10573]EGV61684.1 hypothetical protein CANTEDRAFT_115144 [Yamadazyma tenuis ATCC 10573]